jgi:hypothetical protein
MSSADDRAVASLDHAMAPELDWRLVDLIAQRVLELLGDRNGDEIQLLTVAQVAHCFQVHPSWVYANARRLGALRLGTGPKAPCASMRAASPWRSTIRPCPATGVSGACRPKKRQRSRHGGRSSQAWSAADRGCLSAPDRDEVSPWLDADARPPVRSRRFGANATSNGVSRCGPRGGADGSGCPSDSKPTVGTTIARARARERDA